MAKKRKKIRNKQIVEAINLEDKPRFIRTNLLKFIMQNGMSVREFENNAVRTRLKDTKDLVKVEQHINLWMNYGWLQ